MPSTGFAMRRDIASSPIAAPNTVPPNQPTALLSGHCNSYLDLFVTLCCSVSADGPKGIALRISHVRLVRLSSFACGQPGSRISGDSGGPSGKLHSTRLEPHPRSTTAKTVSQRNFGQSPAICASRNFVF